MGAKIDEIAKNESLEAFTFILWLHEDKIFKEEGYCLNKTKIQDCDPDDIKRMFYTELPSILLDVCYLLEYFMKCSGMLDKPLKHFYFTGW